MGNLGARNIREMQLVKMIIAPSIQTEGKVYQTAQRVGMEKIKIVLIFLTKLACQNYARFLVLSSQTEDGDQ